MQCLWWALQKFRQGTSGLAHRCTYAQRSQVAWRPCDFLEERLQLKWSVRAALDMPTLGARGKSAAWPSRELGTAIVGCFRS